MTFNDKLSKKWEEGKYVCIGLDPILDKIPQVLMGEEKFFEFNKAIIEATHDLVCCYKPNSAFYEALGDKGILQLKKTIDYINKNYPEIPVILDAKRADIEHTNDGYVSFAFDYLRADAITLHPYLGRKALLPFLERKDKGIFVLCKTSNSGSDEFQNYHNLYLQVAKNVSKEWNNNGNTGLVVGATYPEELENVRELDPALPILIPGIGAQGGDLKESVSIAKKNFIISSSRGIIFASSGEDFATAARKETEKLHEQIVKM